MQYRRAKHKGGCYFFTVNIAERNRSLLIDHVDNLPAGIKKVQQNHPFFVNAIVLFPGHLHTLWALPLEDNDYATCWIGVHDGADMQRYWEHLIREDNDFAYIHFNPVKHGYVERAVDRQYSSIHKFISAGILNENWGADVSRQTMDSFAEMSFNPM